MHPLCKSLQAYAKDKPAGLPQRPKLTLLNQGEFALLESFIAKQSFNLSIALHLLCLAFAISAAEANFDITNGDVLFCVDVTAGQWALLLLVLLGQNQLMVGLSSEWLRIGAELLHATWAAEVDLRIFVFNELVFLHVLLWHHQAFDTFQGYLVGHHSARTYACDQRQSHYSY
jgi:hypothetical protein